MPFIKNNAIFAFMFTPGLRIGLDAYYKQAKNLIVEGQFGAPVILTEFNYEQGQDIGVEPSGRYDRGPGRFTAISPTLWCQR